jgi:Na+-driven multidrug efflux pump
MQGIGLGAQPISSYNYGARNAGRVKETFHLLLKVCMTYSVVLWLAIMLFPRVFAGIFSGDAALLDYSVGALRIYCAAIFLFGIQIACQLTFTSVGNAVCSIIVAVVRKFVLLIPLIYIVPSIGILENKALDVYLAEPIADVIAVAFTSILFYFQFRKALKKLNTEEVA